MRLLLAISLLFSMSLGAQQLRKADLGDLKLQSGQVIRNCSIGYRTFGTLNADRSNAILFPTWFTGTSADLSGEVGPGKLIDPAHYYVIAVDALGNGVSSSPSNSSAQPHMRFPQFTLRDMIESQHLLLSKLGINHLKAVMGISMGGMQTFQWAVSYPNFLDFAIPIVGSPRLTSYDLLLWTTEEHAIENDDSWKSGEYTEVPDSMKAVAGIHALALETPDYWVEHTGRDRFDDAMHNIETRNATSTDANNWLRQLQAMISHDISREFGGSMERAAAAVKARMLIVYATQDHMVNPHPAIDIAPLVHAQQLALTGNCGHQSPGCETPRIGAAISQFLGQ